jgi:hypothetical protein
MDDKDSADEQRVDKLKDFSQDRVLKTQQKMAEFLESVALDPTFTDKRLVKVGDSQLIKDVPIPLNVRVAAAKLWKEMFVDKSVGDVKEKAKAEKAKGLDMKKILENLGAEMRKAPDAIAEEGEL